LQKIAKTWVNPRHYSQFLQIHPQTCAFKHKMLKSTFSLFCFA
jgi:hypothetical protein